MSSLRRGSCSPNTPPLTFGQAIAHGLLASAPKEITTSSILDWTQGLMKLFRFESYKSPTTSTGKEVRKRY